MNTATTPADSAGETADPGQAAADEVSIPALRNDIDAIDTEIVRLLAQRVGLSHRIQAARIRGGGTRVELGRERVVIDGYRRVLGPDGAQLAEAVLRVCRGAR